MERRGFARIVFASILVSSRTVRAQTAAATRRIGILAPGDGVPEIEEPLRRLGWIEGKTIVLERRAAKWKLDQLPALARALVRLRVEIIVTEGSDATIAAKNATTTIPIVIAGAGDPVALGIVASLAHPGGNITGYATQYPEIAAKRAALLHELLPTAQRVAVLVEPKGSMQMADFLRNETAKAYRSLSIQPTFIEVSAARQFEDLLAEAVRQHAQGLEVDSLPAYSNVAAQMQAAIRYRLPTIVFAREWLEAGGLLYFDNNEDLWVRVAAMIDKILRGAKPADLPVEQPTGFVLMINLRTAKALGLTIPQSLLLRADEVIQ